MLLEAMQCRIKTYNEDCDGFCKSQTWTYWTAMLKKFNASTQLSPPICVENNNAQTEKCSWPLEKRVTRTTACTKNRPPEGGRQRRMPALNETCSLRGALQRTFVLGRALHDICWVKTASALHQPGRVLHRAALSRRQLFTRYTKQRRERRCHGDASKNDSDAQDGA